MNTLAGKLSANLVVSFSVISAACDESLPEADGGAASFLPEKNFADTPNDQQQADQG